MAAVGISGIPSYHWAIPPLPRRPQMETLLELDLYNPRREERAREEQRAGGLGKEMREGARGRGEMEEARGKEQKSREGTREQSNLIPDARPSNSHLSCLITKYRTNPISNHEQEIKTVYDLALICMLRNNPQRPQQRHRTALRLDRPPPSTGIRIIVPQLLRRT